jgi:hypothetical protein
MRQEIDVNSSLSHQKSNATAEDGAQASHRQVNDRIHPNAIAFKTSTLRE